jgi:hypothetical protein
MDSKIESIIRRHPTVDPELIRAMAETVKAVHLEIITPRAFAPQESQQREPLETVASR